MRYVSIAYRVAGREQVQVEIQDNFGQTVGRASHTDGAGKVLLAGDITPEETDRAAGRIADFRRHERAAYKADLGTADEGPVWTVVGGYEEDEGHSIFHIHAQDVAALSVKMHKAKILYEWVMDEDIPAEEQDKYETIPSPFQPLAIFEGALVSKV